MSDHIGIIVAIAGLLYTIFGAVLSFFWKEMEKVKQGLQVETSLNQTQKEKLSTLERDFVKMEVDVKGNIQGTDLRMNKLVESINNLASTMNQFIAESRILSESTNRLLNKHEEKFTEFDRSIREFYRKNPDL